MTSLHHSVGESPGQALGTPRPGSRGLVTTPPGLPQSPQAASPSPTLTLTLALPLSVF